MVQAHLPILIILVLAVLFSVAFAKASAWFGPRRPTRTKLAVYECGMPPVGDTRQRFSVKFYLVALVFVVLDVEVAFLYPWALSFREMTAAAPWVALADMVFFMLLLAMVYGWLWKEGIFDWGRRRVGKGAGS